jgi:hypothetical protein
MVYSFSDHCGEGIIKEKGTENAKLNQVDAQETWGEIHQD